VPLLTPSSSYLLCFITLGLHEPCWTISAGDASYLKNIRTKEIANGRLAMIACLGFFIQAAYTDKSPVENLLEHVADPFHNNLIESLFN
jgi:hypothetical protein